MEINNIFGLFEDDKKEEKFEGDPQELTPKQILFCLGMFTKLISNSKSFTNNTLKKFKLDKEVENEIKNKSNYYIHNKALFYLTQISLIKKNHFEVVQKNISPELLLATQISKDFFLKIEEYERVKILQDFENFFHLSLV
jgi:hypothetical protein